MAKQRSWRELYPLYYCKNCGRFFKDREGTQEDLLRGQQSSVNNIEKCAKYCKK